MDQLDVLRKKAINNWMLLGREKKKKRGRRRKRKIVTMNNNKMRTMMKNKLMMTISRSRKTMRKFAMKKIYLIPVSYTHLDVYKRQGKK